ncbi:hypothetical protein EVAR_94663_1 [Eumeta japonica]|uniref:Uncharacterized protein n=1 Tax=Eumeta variegata TaxID=151549 RepID=A0A4C1UTL1_EUMVA|nr:hypothetical protein EVAR_94663_1 [Eumeta japonica]
MAQRGRDTRRSFTPTVRLPGRLTHFANGKRNDQYDARNSAAVKFVTIASQWRKTRKREERRKGRGVLCLHIASLAGNSERPSFACCIVHP